MRGPSSRLLLALSLLTLGFFVAVLVAGTAFASEKTHVVERGQTLSGIAARYRITVTALTRANGIDRKSVIRPGQRLVIPSPSPNRRKNDKAPERRSSGGDEMQVLDVPGAGRAYYFEPTGPGRLTLRPVLMYLHGRGGHPDRDCRRWAKVARRLGWLVCPSGPGIAGPGQGWNNNWHAARRIATATIQALRGRYGRRVQLYGNTLMGFSEGAYVAMNVGVREPRTFNRWLIMGADPGYWGAAGKAALQKAKSRVRRVYLITGERDGVIGGTRQVREWLRKTGIPTQITTPDDMGHEVALESKESLYRMALVWLERGSMASNETAPERPKHASR
jgi:hypothetical protein